MDVVEKLWIIGQAFRISYRHMVGRPWQAMVMMFFMTAGYTALFLTVLFLCSPSAFGLCGGEYRYYAVGILLLLVVASSLCLTIVSLSFHASRKREMAIRKLHGGTSQVTVISIFMESAMIILAALFAGLVAAEWWLPALEGWSVMDRAERIFVFNRLLWGGILLFVLQIFLSAALPVLFLLRGHDTPKFLSHIACARKIIG